MNDTCSVGRGSFAPHPPPAQDDRTEATRPSSAKTLPLSLQTLSSRATKRPSYRACVLGGVSAGIVIATLFARTAGLTPGLWIAIASFAVAIALFLAAITKVVFGVEQFSFLHYQIAALTSTGALLAVMHVPVLPALDLLALTLAVAQGIGRIGCASAGCCHGRPFRFGVRYGEGRVAQHWVGARLLPVQGIESCALLLLATATALTIGRDSGTAFVLYALTSAVTRFVLELLRGDARRQFSGLSEAQWICLITAIAIATWQRGATVIVAALLLVATIVLVRAGRTNFDAIARAVFAARSSGRVHIVAKLHLSHGRVGHRDHYTLSSSPDLTPRRARSLAKFIRDLAHPDERFVLLTGDRVHHVVFSQGEPS